ncbi:hypothetical protein BGZ91_011229 [Linnemannia elongata]|nr:hypothetical protein BGZ91_011229 [Linnemannia elongata]KAG0054889.1 hypothetical protein BGZ90_005881 [Linnemannia elongata]
MKFTSIIAFLALSAATVVALPVAENTPVQLYRRAVCDNQGEDVLNKLSQTRNALSQLEDDYYRVARNPVAGPTFNRAKKYLNTIIVEIKDEVNDPVSKRSSGPVLVNARAQFQDAAVKLRLTLESIGLPNLGSRLTQDLDGFTYLSRTSNVRIDELITCWRKAGGK